MQVKIKKVKINQISKAWSRKTHRDSQETEIRITHRDGVSFLNNLVRLLESQS